MDPRGRTAARDARVSAATATRRTRTTTTGATDGPGPLVGVDWLAEHLHDADLRIVHVAPNRRVFNRRHIPGAVYSDLHREIALRGTAPETGDAEREWLIPSPGQVADVLRRWGVGDGDRMIDGVSPERAG